MGPIILQYYKWTKHDVNKYGHFVSVYLLFSYICVVTCRCHSFNLSLCQ